MAVHEQMVPTRGVESRNLCRTDAGRVQDLHPVVVTLVEAVEEVGIHL